MTPTISLQSVNKSFTTASETVVALNEVRLEVNAGEFVCLQGASGSGKTTLINVVAGIEKVDSGSVSVAGTRLDGLSGAARARWRLEHIGIVFQDDNLIPELTAAENIHLPLEALGLTRQQCLDQASHAMTRVGLGALLDRLPADMSGGQRQRVGIARALSGDRSIILADEPCGALDSRTSEQIYAELVTLADQGMTVLMASHDPAAVRFATRVVCMQDGRLIPSEDGG